MDFAREDIVTFASELGIGLPKNLGDLIYSFRYRTDLPASILAEASEGETWIIRPAGRSKYRFVLVSGAPLAPNPNLAITKIPDSTPGIIAKYAFSDEQAVLARVRYNRLIDIFLGIACYSLQNHFRTTVPGMGQVETDEIYVGVDKRGSHYVVPVQAKGGNDKLNRVQIEQDLALCGRQIAVFDLPARRHPIHAERRRRTVRIRAGGRRHTRRFGETLPAGPAGRRDPRGFSQIQGNDCRTRDDSAHAGKQVVEHAVQHALRSVVLAQQIKASPERPYIASCTTSRKVGRTCKNSFCTLLTKIRMGIISPSVRRCRRFKFPKFSLVFIGYFILFGQKYVPGHQFARPERSFSN